MIKVNRDNGRFLELQWDLNDNVNIIIDGKELLFEESKIDGVRFEDRANRGYRFIVVEKEFATARVRGNKIEVSSGQDPEYHVAKSTFVGASVQSLYREKERAIENELQVDALLKRND